jgi:DNA-binding CsgD family transcriptional regulator
VTAIAPHLVRRREELVERAAGAPDVSGLFAAASVRLRRLVPYDAAVWMAFDPATTLPTAPTRAENLGHVCKRDGHSCVRVWELELLADDVNQYRHLARAATPAAGLRLATDDRPTRSVRYREFMRPNGYDDELRAVLRVDGRAWASIGLYREHGRPRFEAADVDLVADMSGPLGAAVRDHARPVAEDAPADGRGPGVIQFAPSGELISINDDAVAWLDELPPDPDSALDLRLPMVIAGTLVRARAIAAQRDRGTARARVRSHATGRWLSLQASCLRGHDGEVASTVLVIEPANASEIAPLITQAYELSAREEQITALIAQGLGTAEIAARLTLSAHTVRDYIKAIFEKVGVSSRGELVARLFSEHYAPVHLDPDTYTFA